MRLNSLVPRLILDFCICLPSFNVTPHPLENTKKMAKKLEIVCI